MKNTKTQIWKYIFSIVLSVSIGIIAFICYMIDIAHSPTEKLLPKYHAGLDF